MKKLKFDHSRLYNFELLGIISPIKEYKLVWSINQVTDWELGKEENITLELTGERRLMLSNFKFELEHSIFRLLKNKLVSAVGYPEIFLVKELKQFDYLLMIENSSDTLDTSMIIQVIKTINDVLYVQPINVQKLKNKENLIF